MTVSDDVLKALSDPTTPVSHLLRLFIQLPAKFCPDDVRAWSSKELSGYDPKEDLPSYRIVPVETRGSVGNGYELSLDSLMLPENLRQGAEVPIRLPEGMAEIEDLLAQARSGEGTLAIDWPEAGVNLLNHAISVGSATGINSNYRFGRVWKVVPKGALIELQERVRVRVYAHLAAIELVSSEPLPASAPASSSVTVSGDNNQIMVHSAGAVQRQLNLDAGDVQGLVAAFQELGLEQTALDDLREIIDSDSEDGDSRLRRALEWAKAQALTAPMGVGGGVLSGMILHHYGLG